MGSTNREEFGELLSAYVDGELDAGQSGAVERMLRDDPAARRIVDELRRAAGAVAALPRHPAPANLAGDLQASLERSALLDDVRSFEPHIHRRRAPWSTRLAAAAVLGLVVVTGGWFVLNRPRESLPSLAANRAERDAGRSGAEMAKVVAPVVPTVQRTFDEQYAAHADLAALQSHPFSNESSRIQLTVESSAQSEALAARIEKRLAEERVVDLRGATGAADRADAVFLRGKPGVNFQAAGETQMLVRARPRQIAAVLGELDSAGVRDDALALSTGSLRVEGLAKTQEFVGLLGKRSAAEPKSVVADAPRREEETTPRDFSWLNGLLKVVNLDPELVDSDHPVHAPQPAATSVPNGPERADHPASASSDRMLTDAGDKQTAETRGASAGTSMVDERVRTLSKRVAPDPNDEKPITLVIELTPDKSKATPLPSPPPRPRPPVPSPNRSDPTKGSR